MYSLEDAMLLEAYVDLQEKLIEEGRMMEIPSMQEFQRAYEIFRSDGFDPNSVH